MALLTILQEPNPLLRKKSRAVDFLDPTLDQNIADMSDTLEHAEGLALAAPQVGLMKRLIVFDTGAGRFEQEEAQPLALFFQAGHRFFSMINPVIEERSSEKACIDEGCLSIQDVRIPVERAAEITVSFKNRLGQAHQLKAKGLLSICIQHEVDHLDGILTLDHLSPLKRALILKKAEKEKTT